MLFLCHVAAAWSVAMLSFRPLVCLGPSPQFFQCASRSSVPAPALSCSLHPLSPAHLLTPLMLALVSPPPLR